MSFNNCTQCFFENALSYTNNLPVCHLRDDIMTILVICKYRHKKNNVEMLILNWADRLVSFTPHTHPGHIYFDVQINKLQFSHCLCKPHSRSFGVIRVSARSLFLCWKRTELRRKPVNQHFCNLNVYKAAQCIMAIVQGNTIKQVLWAHLADVHTDRKPACLWAHTDTLPSARQAPRDLLACKIKVT